MRLSLMKQINLKKIHSTGNCLLLMHDLVPMLRVGTLRVRHNGSHRPKRFPRKAWEPDECERLPQLNSMCSALYKQS